MSSVIISGDTSGSVTLQAPATAGNTTVTLPVTSMNIGNGGGNSDTNTVFGAANALAANTSGTYNNAFGRGALQQNTSGTLNSAFGWTALLNNTTGSNNTAIGNAALVTNTTGSNNTGIGYQALTSSTTASSNTAVGYQAGYNNTVGQFNVLLGYQAGYRSAGVGTIGDASVYIGYQAGYANQGNNNIGIGNGALSANTSGTFNVAIGVGSGNAITTGTKNTIIGAYSGNQSNLDIRTSSNYIVLSDGDGNPRSYIDNNGWMYTLKGQTALAVGCHQFMGANANSYEMIIANTNATPLSEYIVDIRFSGATPNNTSARFLACTDPTNEKAAIYSNGGFVSRANSYGTYSDIKLKDNIIDATPKLNDLLQLKVRNFNFKDEPEKKQIGFIAQELETIFPGLVEESQDRGSDGVILETTTKTIKTSVLVPMLVKAIQELNAKVIELEAKLESK